jgi:quercetin dioxygenase-like cupin family protein
MNVYRKGSGKVFVPPDHEKAEAQLIFSRDNGSRKASILITTLAVGGGSTAAEVHADSDQIFFVLEGTAAVHSNERLEATLNAGDGLHIPAGEWHAFKNAGDRACRLYIVTVPPIGDTR